MVFQREQLGRARVSLDQRLLTQIDACFSVLQVRKTQRSVKPGIFTNERQRLSEKLHGTVDRIPAPAPHVVPCSQVAFVGGKIVDGALTEAALLGSRQLQFKRLDDLARELLLDRKDIFECTVVCARPAVDVLRRINQLRRDPQAAIRAADAAFHEVADAQLFGDCRSAGACGTEYGSGSSRSNL